jgi:hypothetical protein
MLYGNVGNYIAVYAVKHARRENISFTQRRKPKITQKTLLVVGF